MNECPVPGAQMIGSADWRATPTSRRFVCASDRSVVCDRGEGSPTRKACHYCGSPFRLLEGTWALFVWRQDGQYPLASAVRTCRSKGAADRACSGTDLVVRFVRSESSVSDPT